MIRARHPPISGLEPGSPYFTLPWPNARDVKMEPFDRITQRPEIMGGKACIRGLRVTVGAVVGQIGAGRTVEDILADYPYLEREDVLQALRYAAWRSEEREVALAGG